MFFKSNEYRRNAFKKGYFQEGMNSSSELLACGTEESHDTGEFTHIPSPRADLLLCLRV